MSIALVAAVAKNGVIGAKNDLPWYLPEDLKHFKLLTTNKTVLMGRKTFESILKRLGKPLPNRKNVVVTRDPSYKPNQGSAALNVPQGGAQDPALQRPADVIVYHSINEALNALAGEDIMVAGGGEIFNQTIGRADTLYITEVSKEVEGDVYFPKINPTHWKETAREPHEGFSFVTYQRK